MYTPEHFRGQAAAAAYAFMMAYPFGLAVTVADGEPFVSHVPFIVEPASCKIRWHLAAANPQCAQLAAGAATTLIFHGPHAYISPHWYAQPNVPTWNYVAVHARGRLRGLAPAETAEVVAALSRTYEGAAGLGEFAESSLYTKLLTAIRGFELTVEHLIEKRKLSQNRPAADQASVATQLRASTDQAARAIGEMMQRNLDDA